MKGDVPQDMPEPMCNLIDALAKGAVQEFLHGPKVASPVRTCLYRHFAADGTLLYAGISSTPKQRKHHHRWASQWFPLVASSTEQWFENRTDAMAAERLAIKTERPQFNLQGAAVAPKETPDERR